MRKEGAQGKSVTAQTRPCPQAPSTRIDQRGSAPELLVLRGSGGGKESVSRFGSKNQARVPARRFALLRAEALAGHGSQDHAEKAHDSDEVGGHSKAGYALLKREAP